MSNTISGGSCNMYRQCAKPAYPPPPKDEPLIKHQGSGLGDVNAKVERKVVDGADFLSSKLDAMNVNDKPAKMVYKEADMALSDLLGKKVRRKKGAGLHVPGAGLILPGQSGAGMNLL
eukprot:Lithocolla_globosa_v1_NODE_2125_length_2154_cov_87.383516.p2 type:complete len:118 gc:universal NODE_2125_length_2154_cov_87.383516:2153-1800(-)